MHPLVLAPALTLVLALVLMLALVLVLTLALALALVLALALALALALVLMLVLPQRDNISPRRGALTPPQRCLERIGLERVWSGGWVERVGRD